MASRKNIWNRKRFVAERDGFQCFWCRTKLSLRKGTLDHIICASRGGTAERENLVWACKPCNSERGNLPAEFFAEKKLRELLAKHREHQAARGVA